MRVKDVKLVNGKMSVSLALTPAEQERLTKEIGFFIKHGRLDTMKCRTCLFFKKKKKPKLKDSPPCPPTGYRYGRCWYYAEVEGKELHTPVRHDSDPACCHWETKGGKSWASGRR